MFSTDGLLLLLVADVVGLGGDKVNKFGTAVEDQLPVNNQLISNSFSPSIAIIFISNF